MLADIIGFAEGIARSKASHTQPLVLSCDGHRSCASATGAFNTIIDTQGLSALKAQEADRTCITLRSQDFWPGQDGLVVSLLVSINGMSLVPEVLRIIEKVCLPCCAVQPGSSIGQVIIKVAGRVELVDAIGTVLSKVGGTKAAMAQYF